MWPRTEIVYLKIGSGSNSKEGINRFRPKTYVRIQPDVSILGTEVILYTNYPEKGNCHYLFNHKTSRKLD